MLTRRGEKMQNKKWSSCLRVDSARQKYSKNQRSTNKLETDRLCYWFFVFVFKKERDNRDGAYIMLSLLNGWRGSLLLSFFLTEK
jgi:hypothetical protein